MRGARARVGEGAARSTARRPACPRRSRSRTGRPLWRPGSLRPLSRTKGGPGASAAVSLSAQSAINDSSTHLPKHLLPLLRRQIIHLREHARLFRGHVLRCHSIDVFGVLHARSDAGATRARTVRVVRQAGSDRVEPAGLHAARRLGDRRKVRVVLRLLWRGGCRPAPLSLPCRRRSDPRLPAPIPTRAPSPHARAHALRPGDGHCARRWARDTPRRAV